MPAGELPEHDDAGAFHLAAAPQPLPHLTTLAPRPDPEHWDDIAHRDISGSGGSNTLTRLRAETLARSGAFSIADAYEHCRVVARTAARTFYYGSLFLPPEKRRASWALYAFCRTVDDLADRPGSGVDAKAQLAFWRHALIATYEGRPEGPVMTAWADMLRRFDVPLAPTLELLDGVEMDLTGAPFETFADLNLYCYRVAGTVGLLMAPVLGYADPDALGPAVDLGIAMQLTNILRDIGEDRAAGRCYLPLEDLRRFGYGLDDLASGVRNAAFVALMEFEIARAEAFYHSGLRGVRLLAPDARLAISLSATLYRAILGRIRRNGYDVFSRRAHVSRAGKLAAIPGVWLRLRTGGL